MIRLVGLLMLGLKAWMLHDAYRRRADGFWYFVIVGVPGGSLIYFVAVRAQDPDARRVLDRVLRVFRMPPGVATLQAIFDESPSHENRLRLAQGLFDAQRTADARAHFRALHERQPGDPAVLFGLALCELELGEHGAAVDALQMLIEKKPGHEDFAAFPVLARALWASGEQEAALSLLQGLARREPRLPHRVLLARYLRRAGDAAQAQGVLTEALEQHERAPKHVRRQYGHWAQVARKQLAELR